MENIEEYLKPGSIIDSDSRIVVDYMKSILGREKLSPTEKAVMLYSRVRDDIMYDPYMPFFKPEHYRSSNVIKLERGFCVPKAGLLCAVARAAGIPARVGFATVRNHLITKQLLEFLGCDLFSYHGYTELWLNGKWVKATPAFNSELCALHKVPPLDFDGINDSIFHAFNSANARFMEYITYHGEFHDIPVDIIVKAWEEVYGRDRIAAWKEAFTNRKKYIQRDFMKEDVI
jgi:transglutaminase-like putative cysteine protease